MFTRTPGQRGTELNHLWRLQRFAAADIYAQVLAATETIWILLSDNPLSNTSRLTPGGVIHDEQHLKGDGGGSAALTANKANQRDQKYNTFGGRKQ